MIFETRTVCRCARGAQGRLVPVYADETIFPTMQWWQGPGSGIEEQFAHQLTARRVNLVLWPGARFGCSSWPINVRFDRSL